MSGDGVKEVRRDGRRERSRRTAALLVTEARAMFVAHGYVATSVEAVAAQAGVSPQSVYNRFGSKHQLLEAVLDTAIAGDDEQLAVVQRAWMDARDDGPAAIRRFARAGAAIVAHAAPVYDVVRRASSRPELAAILAENRRRRRADQRHLLGELAAAGHLRPDVDVARAADTVYGLMNEEVCLLLTGDCGWSEERFASWLGDLLVSLLA